MRKKITIIFCVFFGLICCACSGAKLEPQFSFSTPSEENLKYSFDKINNVVNVDRLNVADYITLKITPPSELKDYSNVQIWCDGEVFNKQENCYSDGNFIYITLNGRNNLTTHIEIKWTKNSKKQDYFVKFG